MSLCDLDEMYYKVMSVCSVLGSLLNYHVPCKRVLCKRMGNFMLVLLLAFIFYYLKKVYGM